MQLWDPITQREREHRLESMNDIEARTICLLRDAGVSGRIPTPVDPILRVLGLRQVPLDLGFIDRYSTRLGSRDAETLQRAFAKIHGWKTGRVVCVHPSQMPGRSRKVAFHECAHEALPWHQISGQPEPTRRLLELFDDEANAFAGELLFHGRHFDAAAASMPVTRASILRLMNIYEAPWHDTLVRFVERHSEPLVLLIADGAGQRVVAAAEPALALGLDEDPSLLQITRIESFNVGLRIVGVRRYELAVAARRGNRRVA